MRASKVGAFLVSWLMVTTSLPALGKKSAADSTWNNYVQGAIASLKSNGTSQESEHYLEQAIREAEKFKQPDVRLAGSLHMLALLRVLRLPMAGFGGGGGPDPAPPWGRVPMAIHIKEAHSDSKSNLRSPAETQETSMLRRAVNICEQLPEMNRRFVGNCQFDLAYAQCTHLQCESAEDPLLKAISNYEKGGNKKDIATSLFLLAECQDEKREFAKADASLRKAIELYESDRELRDREELPYMLYKRALYALWEERFDDAQALLRDTALEAHRSHQRDVYEVAADASYYLACIQFMRMNYADALPMFQRALETYEHAEKMPQEALAESTQEQEPTVPAHPATNGSTAQTADAQPEKVKKRKPLQFLMKRTPQAPTAPEAKGDAPTENKGDGSTTDTSIMPFFEVPFDGVLAQSGTDTFSTGSNDSFSSEAPRDQSDFKPVQIDESKRLSASEVLTELFKRRYRDLPKLSFNSSGCAYSPNKERAMRMIALLNVKTKGQAAGASMDIMANAVSSTQSYVPQDVPAKSPPQQNDRYLEGLVAHFNRTWLPPESTTSRRATVSLSIGANGQLVGLTLDQLSNNQLMDQSVLKAIAKAPHLPKPSAGTTKSGPIELVFNYHRLYMPGEKLPAISGVYLKTPTNKELDRQLYMGSLLRRIQQHWKPARFQAKRQTRAHIKLTNTGQLQHFCVVKPSGDAEWDRSVVAALTDAGPYQPLPATIGKTVEAWFDFTSKQSGRKVQRDVLPAARGKTTPMPELGPYLKHIQERIMQSNFPPAKPSPEAAIVQFKIHRDGSVSDLRLAKSSGSNLTDEESLKAVARSVPFYPLPANAPQLVDVELTFACYGSSSWTIASAAAEAKFGSPAPKIVVAKLDLLSEPRQTSVVPGAAVTHDVGSSDNSDETER